MKAAIQLLLTGAASSLVLLLAGSASAAHTVFPPGSPFTGGTDIITDFPTCFSGTIGPVGLLNDGSHFFVDDFCTHFNNPTQDSTTYRFLVTGGSALTPQVSAQNGLTHGITVDGGAMPVTIQSLTQIKLSVCGGLSSITLGPDGITIMGLPMVKIN